MNAFTMRQVRGAGGEVRHVPTAFIPVAKKGARKPRPAPDPIRANGDASAQQLRQLIERVERVAEEVRSFQDDLKDIYSEAKAIGFDPSTMKAIVKLRRMDTHHRAESEALLETYLASLGMK